ncbi:MAG: iron ABC transporter permease [Myxococcaceae bacterium]|nr:iron ABC transporter permease [Myxococcaceae bacterium]
MKRSALTAALLAPLVIFALLPLAVLVVRGLRSPDAWGLLVDPATFAALRGTTITSAGAAAIAFGLGLPLGLLLGRTDLPWSRAWRALFALPAAVPPFIFAMGWQLLANPRTGLLNTALHLHVDIYSSTGIAFVLGLSALPLVLLPTLASLEQVDAAWEEAARLAGAGPWRTLRDVALPLALPAAGSGAALAFLSSASAFGVPYLLGVTASPPIPTLTTRIWAQVLLGAHGLDQAGALALWLLGLSTLVLALAQRLGKRGRVSLASGKGARRTRLPLGPSRVAVSATTGLVAFVLVVLPLLVVVVASLQKNFGTFDAFTTAHWARLSHDTRTLGAFGQSALLALGTGVIVTGAGLALAWARSRLGQPFGAVAWLAAWPYAIPGTVLALGLILAFSLDTRVVLFDSVALVLALMNTSWLLLVAFSVRHLALGLRAARDGLERVDRSLAEAARLSGANRLRAFLDGTLPQLRGPLVAGFTLAVLASLTELTMATLLLPPGTDLLGTLLFELMSYADPAGAAVLACAVVAVVLLGQAAIAAAAPRKVAS